LHPPKVRTKQVAKSVNINVNEKRRRIENNEKTGKKKYVINLDDINSDSKFELISDNEDLNKNKIKTNLKKKIIDKPLKKSIGLQRFKIGNDNFTKEKEKLQEKIKIEKEQIEKEKKKNKRK
jgi:hypothetical protein